MPAPQTAENFWSRVHKPSADECWEWTGSRNSTGYGSVAWNRKVFTAHRVAAWLSGMVDSPSAPVGSRAATFVLHRCDNRACCNPKHFFLGSYSDNQLDAYAKKRQVQPRGQKHANAKLTDKQASAIREEYAEGATQTSLAAKYSVSQAAVSLITRGKTYKPCT